MPTQQRPFTGQTQALGQTPRPARPWYAARVAHLPPVTEAGKEPLDRPPVDGFTAWYDLSQRESIEGDVSRVDDLSGNGHHLGPAPNGNPSVGRYVHDLHTLDCNASADEALTCGDNLALSTSTIFMVVRVDEVNSGRTFFGDDGASAPGHTVQMAAGPVFRMDAGTALDSGITVEAGAAYVLAAQFAGDSTSRLYVNGVGGTTGDAGSDTLAAFNIMAAADDFNCVDGALGEVIIYPSVLSSADRQLVEQYLLDKWAVGYPHIQSQAHGQTASGTSHSITMPDGVEVGDTLTIHASVRPTGGGGPGTVSFPGDWTEFTNSTTDEYHVGAWKVADGSEGASITVTSDAASEAIYWSNRIVDHNGGELEYDEFGGPATPDSPSLTPSWGEAKNLWLASTGLQSGSAVFDQPTDYVGFQQRGHDAERAAFAFRKYQAATDDPSSWGGGFDNQQSFTVAIRGAPPPPTVYEENPTGTVTPAGALTRQTNKLVDGALTPAGTVAKQVNTTLTGSVTPSGALTNTVLYGLAATGSVTPSGALLLTTIKQLAGTLPSSGALTRQTNQLLAGAVTPAGTVAKQANVLFGGTVAPAGALTNHLIATLNLTGSVTPTSTITRQVNVGEAGTIGPNGGLVRTANASVTGAVTPAGAVTRATNKLLDGTAGTAGTLAAQVSLLLAGTAPLSGTAAKQVNKLLDGLIASAGTLSNTFIAGGGTVTDIFPTGTVTPTGALTRQANLGLAGQLPPAGSMAGQVHTHLSGTLTPAGTVGRQVNVLLAGQLTSAGAVTRVTNKLLAGTLGLAGTLSNVFMSGVPSIPGEGSTGLVTAGGSTGLASDGATGSTDGGEVSGGHVRVHGSSVG